MLKRVLTVIMMACLFPVLAQAATWSLTTWARTAGGAIQVGSNAPRTALQGALVTTYATNTPVTVTVLPNAGYIASKVIYNGTTLLNPTQTAFEVNGPNAQSVQAYFALQRFSVTASVTDNAGGAANPTVIGNFTLNQVLTSPIIITYTPATTSFALSSLTGVPGGAITNPAVLPAATGQAVTVTLPVGFTITSNIALTGTFTSQNPVANAGSPQTAFTGATSVTLDGTGSQTSGGIAVSSYQWAQTGGPAVTLLNANAAVASFVPTVAGTYQFSLTLQPGGSTATTTVTVYESLPALVRDKCYNCHSASGVGVASNVFNNWSSSGHKTKGVVCSQCHVGADTGGHPGLIRSGSVSKTTFDYTVAPLTGSSNFCVTCHSPSIITDFAASKHSIRAGAASCSFCHVNGVHNPSVACTDCHNSNNAYGLVWPPAAFTFHSSFTGITNICKACHTTHNPKVLSIKASCP